MKGMVTFVVLLMALGLFTNMTWAFEGATNTFYGTDAAHANPAGNLENNDTFIGAHAGYWNSGGSDNTFIGWEAGALNNSSTSNTFVGSKAGYSNQYGFNTFVGASAGYSNSAGTQNTFIGADAGYSNTTGILNTFVGSSAGNSNTTGKFNVYIGTATGGQTGTNGDLNVHVGASAGSRLMTGYNNTLVGADAGSWSFHGHDNVFIGHLAGFKEDGAHRLYIDNCFTGGDCLQPLIYGEFDNRIVRIDGMLEIVTIATPSDIRYKKDINPLAASLEKVLKLRGVSYAWDKDRVTGAGYNSGKQIGMIAQEVEAVLPELVHTDSKGYKTLSYDKVVPVLVEAVKEQHAMHRSELEIQQKKIDEKDAEIQSLKKAVLELAGRLAALESSGKALASK